MINYETTPGAVYVLSKKVLNNSYIPGSTMSPYSESYTWKIDTILFKDVLDDVHRICREMGADALVKNEMVSNNYNNIKNPVTINGYRITGFAIKRK